MAGFWSSAVEDLLDQVTYKAFSPIQEVYQSELEESDWKVLIVVKIVVGLYAPG